MPETKPNTDVVYELAGAVSVLSQAVRTLNKSLFGEKSTGPEDGYGQMGEHIAFLCTEVEQRLAALIKHEEADHG